MITLITGVPGSGKTLYCVSEILPTLIGSVVNGQDGNPDITRIVYTNINGLLLDHESIDGGLNGLTGWQNWCKPGDCIVFDEVQSVWKPRPNGSKIPDDIGALETHRHKGVDFVLLTQHPMLLDQNVRALVGRHLHIRRMGGMGAAIQTASLESHGVIQKKLSSNTKAPNFTQNKPNHFLCFCGLP
jgi:zona occludens toxin